MRLVFKPAGVQGILSVDNKNLEKKILAYRLAWLSLTTSLIWAWPSLAQQEDSLPENQITVIAPAPREEISEGEEFQTQTGSQERVSSHKRGTHQDIRSRFDGRDGVFWQQGTEQLGANASSGIQIRGLPANHTHWELNDLDWSGSGLGASHAPEELNMIGQDYQVSVRAGGDFSGGAGSGAGGKVRISSARSSHDPRVVNLQVGAGSFGHRALGGWAQSRVGKRFGKIRLGGSTQTQKGDYTLPDSPVSQVLDQRDQSGRQLQNNDSSKSGGQLQWSDIAVIPKTQLRLQAGLFDTDQGLPGSRTVQYRAIRSKSRAQNIGAISKTQLGPHLLKLGAGRRWWDQEWLDPEGEFSGFAQSREDRYRIDQGRASADLMVTDFWIFKPEVTFSAERLSNPALERSRDQWTWGAKSEFWLWEDQWQIGPYYRQGFASGLSAASNFGLGQAVVFSDQWKAQLNLMSAFRYPSFAELYADQGLVVGNPDLAPERSYGGDIGLAYHSDRVQSSVSYFLLYSDNLIEYVLSSGFRYSPSNFSKTVSEGVTLKNDFQLTQNQRWRLKSSLSFQNVVDRDPQSPHLGRLVVGRPRWYGHQELNWDWHKKGKTQLTTGFRAKGAFERYLNRSNTKKLPDRYQIDWTQQFVWGQYWAAQLEFRNLFDRNNVDTRDQYLEGRGIYASLQKSF